MSKPFTSVFPLCGALALCAALSNCGGGSTNDTVPPPPVPVASVIQFVGTFEPNCNGCEGSLVIEPIAGATALGNKGIAKVELVVDQGPAQVLTASNAKNAAGQASYAFSFPHPPITYPAFTHTCTPAIGLEITVTDVTGFSYKKYASACQYAVFGGFSDYGDKTITYKASATAPANLASTRWSAGGGYFDNVRATAATTSNVTLKAKDMDTVSTGGSFDNGVADGAILSVSVEGEGGSLASSTIAKKSGQTANAFLVCCGPDTTAAPSTETHTIAFAVSATRYNEPMTGRPYPFNVYYRISDPRTGNVLTEFRGALPNGTYNDTYSEWRFTVKKGYALTLEASPLEADTYLQLYIGGNASDPSAYHDPIGKAMSNRPDASAKLNVFCCKP